MGAHNFSYTQLLLYTLDFKQCILFLLIYDIQFNILEKFENNSTKHIYQKQEVFLYYQKSFNTKQN
jgi:hypothetical protein